MRILTFGRDPGGANALVPIIKALEADSRDHVQVLGQKWALQIFLRYGIKAQEYLSLEEIFPLLKQVDVLLTSTSWPPDTEIELWQGAKKCEVRSLAVSDFWSNYRKRFCDSMDRPTWPDKITAMDSQAFQDMVSEGIPADHIVVTGQPFLEMRANELKKKNSQFSSEEQGRILFLSQPLSSYPNANRLPFDELSTLRLVIETVDALFLEGHKELRLVIRPHPKDNTTAMSSIITEMNSKVPCKLDGTEDGDEALLKSQVIVGLTSMMLIEAALAGRPIISVQPGLPNPDPFPLSRMGSCVRVKDAESLKREILTAIRPQSAREYEPFLRWHLGATSRILKELN